MPNEKEFQKAFVKVRAFNEFLSELRDLESVLKTLSNAEAEMTHMANQREQHRTEINKLEAEISSFQGKLVVAKKQFDADYAALKAESEAKHKSLTGQVAILNGQLSSLQEHIAAARKELNDVANEKRHTLSQLDAENRQLVQNHTSLQEQMAKLRQQLGA